MTKEVCPVCTGSYTGEFSPKWRGPWAKYFDSSGKFIEVNHDADRETRMTQEIRREVRLRELREQGRA